MSSTAYLPESRESKANALPTSLDTLGGKAKATGTGLNYKKSKTGY